MKIAHMTLLQAQTELNNWYISLDHAINTNMSQSVIAYRQMKRQEWQTICNNKKEINDIRD